MFVSCPVFKVAPAFTSEITDWLSVKVSPPTPLQATSFSSACDQRATLLAIIGTAVFVIYRFRFAPIWFLGLSLCYPSLDSVCSVFILRNFLSFCLNFFHGREEDLHFFHAFWVPLNYSRKRSSSVCQCV